MPLTGLVDAMVGLIHGGVAGKVMVVPEFEEQLMSNVLYPAGHPASTTSR